MFRKETEMKTVKASNQHHEWAERFSHDLHTVRGMEFPTTCPQCGLVFNDAQTFLDGTTSVWIGDEGVTEDYDGAGHRVLDIGRTCTCGHILVEEFDTRRDTSEDGKHFRLVFSERMRAIRRQGSSAEEARAILIEFLHSNGAQAVVDVQIG